MMFFKIATLAFVGITTIACNALLNVSGGPKPTKGSVGESTESKEETGTSDPSSQTIDQTPVAYKLTASNCKDPDLTKLVTGETLMLCDGSIGVGVYQVSTVAPCSSDGGTDCMASATYRAAATSGLAAKVLTGQTVAGIAGSAPARPADCTTDGDFGCVATSTFPAADTSALLPSNIKYGVSLGGVAGTQREIKVCKSGRGMTTSGGDSTTPWSGFRAGSGTVSVVNASTTVTGVSTIFTTQLSVGDDIVVGTETRVVATIDSATSLTVTVAFASTAAGQSYTYGAHNGRRSALSDVLRAPSYRSFP